MASIVLLTEPHPHISISNGYVELKCPETKIDFPPSIDTKADYDYDDCSDLEYFKKRFQDMNLEWPLSHGDENYHIIGAMKDNGNLIDSDLIVIKAAYDASNPRQKTAMQTIAKNIDLDLDL